MFANSQVPAMQSQAMAPRALCYRSFAILYSGKSRTPIYVAERLNKVQLKTKITRSNRFFADARLPRAERAELEDYRNSGLDRGHMRPPVTWARRSRWRKASLWPTWCRKAS